MERIIHVNFFVILQERFCLAPSRSHYCFWFLVLSSNVSQHLFCYIVKFQIFVVILEGGSFFKSCFQFNFLNKAVLLLLKIGSQNTVQGQLYFVVHSSCRKKSLKGIMVFTTEIKNETWSKLLRTEYISIFMPCWGSFYVLKFQRSQAPILGVCISNKNSSNFSMALVCIFVVFF